MAATSELLQKQEQRLDELSDQESSTGCWLELPVTHMLVETATRFSATPAKDRCRVSFARCPWDPTPARRAASDSRRATRRKPAKGSHATGLLDAATRRLQWFPLETRRGRSSRLPVRLRLPCTTTNEHHDDECLRPSARGGCPASGGGGPGVQTAASAVALDVLGGSSLGSQSWRKYCRASRGLWSHAHCCRAQRSFGALPRDPGAGGPRLVSAKGEE